MSDSEKFLEIGAKIQKLYVLIKQIESDYYSEKFDTDHDWVAQDDEFLDSCEYIFKKMEEYFPFIEEI